MAVSGSDAGASVVGFTFTSGASAASSSRGSSAASAGVPDHGTTARGGTGWRSTGPSIHSQRQTKGFRRRKIQNCVDNANESTHSAQCPHSHSAQEKGLLNHGEPVSCPEW